MEGHTFQGDVLFAGKAFLQKGHIEVLTLHDNVLLALNGLGSHDTTLAEECIALLKECNIIKYYIHDLPKEPGNDKFDLRTFFISLKKGVCYSPITSGSSSHLPNEKFLEEYSLLCRSEAIVLLSLEEDELFYIHFESNNHSLLEKFGQLLKKFYVSALLRLEDDGVICKLFVASSCLDLNAGAQSKHEEKDSPIFNNINVHGREASEVKEAETCINRILPHEEGALTTKGADEPPDDNPDYETQFDYLGIERKKLRDKKFKDWKDKRRNAL